MFDATLARPAPAPLRFMVGLVKVLVVARDAGIREAVQEVAQDHEQTQVVGCVGDAGEVEDWLFWQRKGWNVAVVDAALPARSAALAVTRLALEPIAGRIVVVVDSPSEEATYRSLGASAVVLRSALATLRNQLAS